MSHLIRFSFFLLLGFTVSCTKPAAPKLVEMPQSAPKNAAVSSDCPILPGSVGPIKLGMSITDARKVAGAWQFKRTSDGEGMALIEVSRDKEVVMTLFAGEDDPESAINEKATIEIIDVADKQCKTPEGVHPGMLVSDIAKIYGDLTQIMMTEIESREYATFTKQPKAYSLRLNEGAKYPPGSNITTSFDAKTTLMQISIRK